MRTGAVARLSVVQLRLEVNFEATLPREATSLRLVNSEPAVATALVGNTRETMLGFTVPLPCFFPVCLAGTHQIPSGPRKRVKQLDGVKQRLIIQLKCSEVGSAVAPRILDWTGGAYPAASNGAARIAALFHPKHARCIERHNNRFTRILAASKIVGASKMLTGWQHFVLSDRVYRFHNVLRRYPKGIDKFVRFARMRHVSDGEQSRF